MGIKGEDYGMRTIKCGTYNSTTNNIEINFDDFVDHIVALIDMKHNGFVDNLADYKSAFKLILDSSLVDTAWDDAINIWKHKEGHVSDSRRIKDENSVENKAYLVKQLYEAYLRIDTALREMEQGASYYEQEIFLNKGINDLRKNISGVDARTEKMFSYGLLRLDTALREMEQGASYYEQEVFLNEGMQSIFDAIQTLEYE